MQRRLPAVLIILGLVAAGAASATEADDVEALRVHVLDCGDLRGIPSDERGAPTWIQRDPTSVPQAHVLVE